MADLVIKARVLLEINQYIINLNNVLTTTKEVAKQVRGQLKSVQDALNKPIEVKIKSPKVSGGTASPKPSSGGVGDIGDNFDTSGTEDKLKRVRNEVMLAWASTRGFRESWQQLGNVFNVTTSYIQDSIVTFAEFDDAIRATAATTGDFEGSFNALRDKAAQLGQTTRFTATEAAEGMQMLTMAGFDAAEAIGAIPTVLDVAAASGKSLGQGTDALAKAADIISNVMSQYSFSVAELPRAANTLLKLTTISNTNMRQLGQAFSYTGSLAKTLGIDIEELSSVLGVLGNAGLQSGRAGRGLNQAIIHLQNITPKGAIALKEIADRAGLASIQINDASGKMRPMADIIDELRQGSITAGEAFTLFGSVAAPSVLALLGQGGDAIRQMNIQLYGMSKTGAAEYIQNLNNVSSGTSQALATIGVSAFNTSGHLKSLPDLLAEIAGSGKTFDEIKVAIEGMFDEKMASNILKIFQDGTKSADVFAESLVNIQNTSATMAAQLEGGVGGAIRALQSMWESIKIATVEAMEAGSGQFDERGQEIGRVQLAIRELINTLGENREAIAGFIADIGIALVKLVEWGTVILGFVANNKLLIGGLLAVIAVIAILKSQFIELSSAVAGQYIASIIAGTQAENARTFAFLRQITTIKGLQAAYTGALTSIRTFTSSAVTQIFTLQGLRAAITGAATATTGFAVATVGLLKNFALLTLSAASMLATLALFKFGIDTILAVNQAIGQNDEANRRLTNTLKAVNEETERQARAGRTLENIQNLGVKDIDNFRVSLIQRLSALEGLRDSMSAQLENQDTFIGGTVSALSKVKAFFTGEKLEFITQESIDEQTSRINSLKVELEAVNQVYNDPKNHAQLKQVDVLLAKREELNKKLTEIAEKEKNIASDTAIFEENLAERVTNKKLSESERAIRDAESSNKEAIRLEEEYANRVMQLSDEIRFQKLSDEDRIREMRRATLNKSAQEADKMKEINEKLAASQKAQVEGDFKLAESLAERAKSLSTQLKDKNAGIKFFEEASKQALAVQETELAGLQETEDRIAEIAAKTPEVQLQIEKEKAESDLAALNAQLDAFAVPRTTQLNIQTTGSIPSAGGGQGFIAGGKIPGLASGGFSGKLPGFSLKDNILATVGKAKNLLGLAGGEMVINPIRTKLFEPLLQAVNNGSMADIANSLKDLMPGLADGGFAFSSPFPSVPIGMDTSLMSMNSGPAGFGLEFSDLPISDKKTGKSMTLRARKQDMEKFSEHFVKDIRTVNRK